MIARRSVAEHVVSATTAGSTGGFSQLDLSIHDRSTIVVPAKAVTHNHKSFLVGNRSPQFGQSRSILAAHRETLFNDFRANHPCGYGSRIALRLCGTTGIAQTEPPEQFCPSLRAQRSNPSRHNSRSWIAS